MILFSIIIPHKNSVDLLKRCIASIPKRNDLEIIIVDDNSDNVDLIYDEIRNWHPSIAKIIMNKEGGGAGNARNIGMNSAKGKWLLFADADDWYEEYFNTFLNKYEKDDIHDVVYINAHCVNDKGQSFPYKIDRYIKNYYKNHILSEKILRYHVWTPWTRMVKKNFVIQHNLHFEELPLGNDMKFGLESSFYANKISAEPNVVYAYYRPHNGSLTDKRYNTETYQLRLRLKVRLNDFYKKVNYPFKWPMWTALSLHRFKSKSEKREAKEIRKDFLISIGGYNLVQDVKYTFLILLGKFCKLL